MTKDIEQAIRDLVCQCNSTVDSHDAMRFSQAALNLAHVLVTHVTVDRDFKTER